ncbi:MAG: nucleotidyltransferase family protein [Chloroflexi bacterium]|nr:nucleotidyltransferase family protein [Chloroflexota bacterium]
MVSIRTLPLLLAYLRAILTGEGALTPTEALSDEVDWPSLVDFAVAHRVAPLLYHSLVSAGPPRLPEPALDRLRQHVRTAARHGLLLTGELLRFLGRLEAQGIPAVPFKGPALASLLYGDPALRQYDDLDILLRREDLPTAESLLASLGYQPQEPSSCLTPRRARAIRPRNPHLTFILACGDARVGVELHSNVVAGEVPFHANLDDIWERCRTVNFAGEEVATLSPEDLLLLLCVHGAKHYWDRLQWLCDVAQLVKTQPAMDWSRAWQEATTAGAQRRLSLGLLLANQLLAAPLPDEVEQKIRRDRPAARAATQIMNRLLAGVPADFESWEMMVFHSRLLERLPDRLSFCLWASLTPGPPEWSLVSLPDRLFPLYYLLRPLRLAAKHIGRSARGRQRSTEHIGHGEGAVGEGGGS